MFRRQYGEDPAHTVEMLRWWLYGNPIQPQIAFIATDTEQDRVVGFYQLALQRFRLDGKSLLGAFSLNTLVDESHRRVCWRDPRSRKLLSVYTGLAELAHAAAVDAGCQFAWAMPNAASRNAFFRHTGFAEVTELRSLYSPGRIGLLAAAALPRSPLVPVLDRLSGVTRGVRLPRSKALSILSASDVEEAAALARPTDDRGLHQVRDATFLRWRYFDSPRNYRVYALRDARGKMSAWCAATIVHKAAAGSDRVPIGVIVDLHPNVRRSRHARVLARHMARDLARDVAVTVALYNPAAQPSPPYGRRFVHLPRRIEPKQFPLGVRVEAPDLQPRLSLPSAWHIAFGDYDLA